MDTERCPQGFVITTQKESTGVFSTKFGTNCTVGCRSPTFTSAEWSNNESIARYISGAGIVSICLLLFYILRDKNRRKQHYVVCIASTSVFSSFSIFMPLLFPTENVFCRNESEGYKDSYGLSMCVAQGAILLYTLLSTCLGCSFQAVELYAKVVYNRTIFPHKKWCIIAILTLPMLSVVVVASLGSFGYAGNYPWCFTVNSAIQILLDNIVYFLPVFLCLATCSFSMIGVIFTVMKTVGRKWNMNSTVVATDEEIAGIAPDVALATVSRQASILVAQYPVTRYLATLTVARTPIFYLFTLVCVWTTVFAVEGDYYVNQIKYEKSYNVWISCVFTNFNGSNTAWQSVCGEHPRLRLKTTVVLVALTCPSILISMGFFPYIKLAHWVWRAVVFNCTRACEILLKHCCLSSQKSVQTAVSSSIPPPQSHHELNEVVAPVMTVIRPHMLLSKQDAKLLAAPRRSASPSYSHLATAANAHNPLELRNFSSIVESARIVGLKDSI